MAEKFGSKLWLVHIAAPDPDFVGYGTGPIYIRDSRAKELKEEHQQLMHIMDDLRSTDNDETLKALITEKLETYAKDALPHYAYAIKEAWRLSQAF